MSRFKHDNFGEVQSHLYMEGIVTSVSPAEDTADVTVPGGQNGEGVPLYYHCESDSEERSNGAIKGAGAGFAKDDEVIVMCDLDGAPIRIVGFVDGIKSCEGFLIYIEVRGGYTIFDTSTGDVLDVEDEDGNKIALPQVMAHQEDDSFIPATDIIERLDGSDWKNLWGNDTGNGDYNIETPDVFPGTEPWAITDDSFMIAEESQYDDIDEESPAKELFAPPLSFDRLHSRYMSGTFGNGDDGHSDFHIEQSHYHIRWNDRESWDRCMFFISRNGSKEELKFATRYLDENFYDHTVDVTKKNDRDDYTFNELIFKTYRKRTLNGLHIPEGYFEDEYTSDAQILFNRYVERADPWDFDDLAATELDPRTTSDVTLLSGYVWFQNHPNWEDVDRGGVRSSAYLANNISWPWGKGYNYRYDKNNSHLFGSFQEDIVWSTQTIVYGMCFDVEEEHWPNSFRGTSGCPWQEQCIDCTEASDGGDMYALHNAHRESMGLEPLVPNGFIASIAEQFAQEMNSGEAPYDHTGFDERWAAIENELDCVGSGAENLNRVDSANLTPVATCFQEWLESDGHRSNIEEEDFTMMGYGSAGEYHVVIFATLSWECQNLNRQTPTAVIKMSTEGLANMRSHMGLEEGDAFPWEAVDAPLYMPDEYVAKGYVPLGPEPFGRSGGGPVANAVLSDGKLREASHNHISVRGIYCDDDDAETKGLVNLVIGYPYGYSPKTMLGPIRLEANSDQVRDSTLIHASYDLGPESEPEQAPSGMARDSALEDAIKDLFEAAFDAAQFEDGDPRRSFWFNELAVCKLKE